MKLRYKTPEILMILGVVLCIVVTIHAAALVDNMAAASYSEKYRYEAAFTVFHSEMEIEEDGEGSYSRLVPDNLTPIDIDAVAKCAEESGFDIKLILNIHVGRNISSAPVEVRFGEFSHRERLADGNYPSEKVLNKVYISQSVLPYTEQKDKKDFLSLNGRSAEVAGVFEPVGSWDNENKVVIYYEECGEELKTAINSALLELFYNAPMPSMILLSDKTDPSAGWEENVSDFEKANLSCRIDGNIYNAGKRDVFGSFSMIFTIILYVFSAANLSVLCSFWIRSRKKELLIRRIHGETNFRIICLFAKDFMKILIYALVFSIPVEMLLSLLWPDAKSSLHSIVITVAVFLLSLALFIVIVSAVVTAAYRKISLVGNTYE